MSSKTPRWPAQLDPGPAEWHVLEILWAHGPCTKERVAAMLGAHGRWSAGAAPTLLTRLLEARLVRYEDRRRRPLHFVAAVARQSLHDELCLRFAARHFGGDLAKLQASVQRCARRAKGSSSSEIEQSSNIQG